MAKENDAPPIFRRQAFFVNIRLAGPTESCLHAALCEGLIIKWQKITTKSVTATISISRKK